MKYFKKKETIKLIPGKLYLIKSINPSLPKDTWFEASFVSANTKYAKFSATEKSLKKLPSLSKGNITRQINNIQLWVRQI